MFINLAKAVQSESSADGSDLTEPWVDGDGVCVSGCEGIDISGASARISELESNLTVAEFMILSLKKFSLDFLIAFQFEKTRVSELIRK